MFKRFFALLLMFTLVVVMLPRVNAEAATLTSSSLTLSDSRISQATTTYSFNMSGVTLSAVTCFTVEFNANADGTGTTLPTGMDISAADVDTGTSDYIPSHTGFAVTVSDNVITYKHASTGQTPASASGRDLVITGITNGSTAGTAYFAIFNTYGNTNCSSSPIDTVTVAYIYTNGQTVSATVDPTLTFTIAGVASGQTVNGATTTITTTSSTVPLGVLSTGANKIAAHDLAIGTNAAGGYTVTTRFTGDLAYGGEEIDNHSGTNASPTAFSAAGTEAFGYTTEDDTLGTGTADRFDGGDWAGFTTSPLEVAYSGTPASDTVRVGYQAGIAATTPAGAYTTTVIYTATPIY